MSDLSNLSPLDGRLLLGDDLVLVWGYRGAPRAISERPGVQLEYVACAGDGTPLGTVAIIPVSDGEDFVPPGIVAAVLPGAAAAAYRIAERNS